MFDVQGTMEVLLGKRFGERRIYVGISLLLLGYNGMLFKCSLLLLGYNDMLFKCSLLLLGYNGM